MAARRVARFAIGSAAVVAGAYFYTEVAGCNYLGVDDLKGQVFILTGATHPGIGKETARELAKQGGTVILAAKNMDRCHQARRDLIYSNKYSTREVECRSLDLKSLRSVRKFVDDLPKDLKLTAVINTAESVKKTQREETHDGLEKQMGVSHFGHFLLTRLLMDKYKDDGRWRIVSVTYPSSGQSSMNFADINSEVKYDPQAVYKQAKLATLLTTLELGKRFDDNPNITANAVYPGLCNTEVFRHVMGNQPFLARLLLQPVLRMMFTSPEKACQSVLFAVLSPKLTNVSGKYINECRIIELPSEASVNAESARKLWDLSEQVVADPSKFVASQTAAAQKLAA
ncbi:putative Retinol dehydrogenase 13 [Hypsibius exemplaris]|uniref:Retinol dehydrogenase 13 n=1 Tax=Hypsibius exemplaris TaxID=2072580 RepID=A0A1W0WRY6_HYPEX|nr:putative Retinol dehydrogenase 13 [Hypsibius exemplaris]